MRANGSRSAGRHCRKVSRSVARLAIKLSVATRSRRGLLDGEEAIEEIERGFVDFVLHFDVIAEFHRGIVL